MIDIKGLYKDFGSLHVLKGITLHIDQGEIISIIGPSGSGKSTLLRSINLLEEPTFGEIWVEGRLITPPDPYLHPEVIRASNTYKRLSGTQDDAALIARIKKEDLLHEKHEGARYRSLLKEIKGRNFESAYEVRKKIGMVFQHFNLFPHMTVLDNMIYAPMKVLGIGKEEAAEAQPEKDPAAAGPAETAGAPQEQAAPGDGVQQDLPQQGGHVLQKPLPAVGQAGVVHKIGPEADGLDLAQLPRHGLQPGPVETVQPGSQGVHVGIAHGPPAENAGDQGVLGGGLAGHRGQQAEAQKARFEFIGLQAGEKNPRQDLTAKLLHVDHSRSIVH